MIDRNANDTVKLCPNCRSFNDLSESNICQYCDFNMVEGKFDEKSVPLDLANQNHHSGKVFKGFYLSVPIFSILLVVVLVVVSGVKEPPTDVESFIEFYKLLLVPMLINGIAMLSLLYKAWASIQDGRARTTPGRAVGFMLVPVFNLYWSFRVIYGFAEDYNRFLDRYQIKGKRLSLISFITYTILSITSWVPLEVVDTHTIQIGLYETLSISSRTPLPLIRGLLNLFLVVLHFYIIARTCDAINVMASHTEGINVEDGESTYDISPPPIRSANAASYCPICKSEYREGFSQCNSCQVELTPYDAAV